MAEATTYKDADTVDRVVPTGGYTSGEMLQLCDGRAAYVAGLRSLDAGEEAALNTSGQTEVAKDTTKSVLAGGKLFWDRSASKATPIKTADSFFIGSAVFDAAAAATTVVVDLNVKPRYVFELGAPGNRVVSVATASAGSPTFTRDAQGYHQLLLASTSEAECIDCLSVDSVPQADGPIFEAVVTWQEKGDDAAVDSAIGLVNASHTSDPDSITESVFVSVNGNETKLNAESDDGATEVNATDTTKVLVEGTYQEIWIDLRDPTDAHIYIDGVEVLAATAFKVDVATGPWKALALVEKSAGAHVPCVRIESMTLRSTDLAAA